MQLRPIIGGRHVSKDMAAQRVSLVRYRDQAGQDCGLSRGGAERESSDVLSGGHRAIADGGTIRRHCLDHGGSARKLAHRLGDRLILRHALSEKWIGFRESGVLVPAVHRNGGVRSSHAKPVGEPAGEDRLDSRPGARSPAMGMAIAFPDCRRGWAAVACGVMKRTIQLEFEHAIHFTDEVFEPANPLLKEVLLAPSGTCAPKVLVVLDEGLHLAQPSLAGKIQAYFEPLRDAVKLVIPPMILEGGERLKNSYFHVSEIQSKIDRYDIDRHSYLVAVGGGALLDVAGLAAATAHRGVRHVRIPSTTLSQDDSGVGVKNGINAFGKKNFIGSFAVPHTVIIDFALLHSLSDRDKRSGYSEAVKVACIKDAAFFEALERDAEALRQFELEAMKRMIRRSAELHVEHIATSGDPFEMGSARPLDFGHWSAHKLEQLSEFRIRHGEAVAIGIALDTVYSRHAGLLPASEAERVLRLLEALGFDLYANELCNVDSQHDLMVLRGLEDFRTHLGGELTVTLLRGIGQGFEAHEMDAALVADAIQELQHRHVYRPLKNQEADGLPPTGAKHPSNELPIRA